MALLLSVIGFAIWSLIVMLVGTKLMPEPQTKADFAETFSGARLCGCAGPVERAARSLHSSEC